MELSRQQDAMPADFTSPCLQGNFLDWAVRDLTHSWGEGGRAWVHHVCWALPVRAMFIGPPAILGASLPAQCPGIAFYPERFCCWSCYIDNAMGDDS